MFRASTTLARTSLKRGISTASAVQAINGTLTRTASSLGYWARVGKELAKEVYVRENLQFPKLKDWPLAQKELWSLERIRSMKLDEAARFGLILAELAGFFAIGEVIGKRNLIGYKV